MFCILLTLLAIITSIYDATIQNSNSTLETIEKQLYNGNVDPISRSINDPDKVSKHVNIRNISKIRDQFEGNDTTNLCENRQRTGNPFVSINGTSAMSPNKMRKPDIFVMHDEPYYSPDWWLGKESQEDQVRFMLTKPKDSPYAVLLTANTTMGPIVCSGTLVTARWVLTAASCLTRIKIVSNILIYAGGRSLQELNRKRFIQSQAIKSSTYYVHPNYAVYGDNTVVNDIALVKAKEKFNKSISVSTVQLSTSPWSHHGFVTCSVTGFGRVKLYINDARDFMRKTYSFSVIKPCRCFEKEEKASAWLCPYPSKKTGVCEGDFGSGLICDGKLVGVTSVLIPMANFQYCSIGSSNDLFSAECGTIRMMTTFHEIYPYLEWIKKYTHSNRKKQTKGKIIENSATSTAQVVLKLNIFVLAFLVYYAHS